MKQNVKVLRWYGNNQDMPEPKVWTYEYDEYLEEGTEVLVNLTGYEAEGVIVYEGHAYDGPCKKILRVLSRPSMVVVV